MMIVMMTSTKDGISQLEHWSIVDSINLWAPVILSEKEAACGKKAT